MNSSDIVISLLGESGKKQWTRSEILEILSKELKIDKKEAAEKFDTMNKRTDFFEKIGDTPSKYEFSKSGELRYQTLKKRQNEETEFRTDIEEFIKIYYWDSFLDCVNNHSDFLEIKFDDLQKGLPYIADALIDSDPAEAISKLNKGLEEISIPVEDNHIPKISIYNFGQILQVENLRNEHVGKFVEVEGRVIFQTPTRSELVVGMFKCPRCGETMRIPQETNKHIEPYLCFHCERKSVFKLLDEPDSFYIDAQEVLLESLQGEVSIRVHLTESLCRPPKDRDAKVVRVCGIVKRRNVTSKAGAKSNYFEWMIEANSIRFADDMNSEPPTEEDIKLFESWAKDPIDLRKRLLESVAPNIYGAMDIKDICCLALFSDWTWDVDPSKPFERSSIHILLFGDPGVAKSQIMKDIVFLSPKGKLGQITNMTKGGLSTSAVQEGGEWCVKSGFFSLADQGIAGLDELDKMDDDNLKCLVTVLEDQVQKVSKAGKNDLTFNTREAVIATANPKRGHLGKEDVMEHIKETLPAYIFQRFDCIIAIRDIPDKEKDRIIIKNINAIHSDTKTNRKTIQRTISPELFRKYVLYARTKPVPEFALNSQKLIEEYYLKRREVSNDYPVIGARQGNNLNRVARAVARREMAPLVTEDHIKYAISLLSAGLSTLNDEGDYGVYNYGRTRSQAEMVKAILGAIRTICIKESCAMPREISFTSGLDSLQVEHTLILMERNREVYRMKGGYRIP